MITTKPAAELRVGDVFSTDGYVVQHVVLLSGGGAQDEVAVYTSRHGETKSAFLAPDAPCPVYTPDPE